MERASTNPNSTDNDNNDEAKHLDFLIGQRKALESEASVISEELKNTPVGLKGSLVDPEGFPRSDVDVYDIRAKRQRLACIQTDYKNIMAEIEKEVLRLHSLRRPSSAPSTNNKNTITGEENQQKSCSINDSNQPPPPPSRSGTADNSEQQSLEQKSGSASSIVSMQPFALIDEVFTGSPAQEAGMHEGDLLLKFGTVDHSNHRNLVAIVDVVSNNIGQVIHVKIERDGAQTDLQLTPHSWGGRGLVGCHFQPL